MKNRPKAGEQQPEGFVYLGARWSWSSAIEFATTVALLHFLLYVLIGRYGGPLFATTFDRTAFFCAAATSAAAFPFVVLAGRYRR
jgi:hypothetical protein